MTARIIAVAAVFAFGLQAASISLENDFSTSNGNPNGQWSYLVGTTLLTPQIPISNGNPQQPAFNNGYFGTGNNLYVQTPDVARAAVNGSAAGETDLDFLAGDLLVHSANDGTTTFLNWTASTDGDISGFSFDIWYAHSAAGARSNDFALYINNTLLAANSLNLTQNFNRSNAYTYINNPGFSVLAGDVISLAITKSANQGPGSIDGVNLDFTFTPTEAPEPGTALLAIPAIAGLLYRRRMNRR